MLLGVYLRVVFLMTVKHASGGGWGGGGVTDIEKAGGRKFGPNIVVSMIVELFRHRELRAARADAARAGVEAVTPEEEIGESLLDVQVCQQHHQMVKPRVMDPLGMHNNHCENEKQ